jgi:hypothetical protein
MNHLQWVISPGRGAFFADPSCATAAPSGRHATRPNSSWFQNTMRNLAADADVTLEDRSDTSLGTSTAAHSFSPSQDPERAGVIDGLADHLPAAVALHEYRDRDVVSDRCAAEHAAMGTASPPVKVLVRLILGLVGFGPRYTSSLIGMIQVCRNLDDGRPAFLLVKAVGGPGWT